MEEAVNTPTSTQEFCLRWNNFHSSLVSAFDGFKNESDFVDVTLACEGQFIKAHKMLLSACSVFFRDLLKANPCQHPIVILPPDVKFVDLERMMRFIYQGEVNVLQDHLPRFLKTAEMLKIRGLAEENEKKKILQCPSPKGCDSGSGSERDNVSVIPKRPRLSTDGFSGTTSENPKTPIDDSSQMSGPDSDSEMIPVKQEMIEFKECDFEGVECESFFSDGFIKLNSATTSSAEMDSSTHTNAPPPPPGSLLPSYVPPMQVKPVDGQSRSSSQPVGGLIRRFLEECLQLPDPSPLLMTYTGLETTPHFQLLRSVAKEWSYCRNATQNYSSFGGNNKRQRASSRLIDTFENIDSLRNQLSQILHAIIVMEVGSSGSVQKICKAELAYVQQQQLAQQQAAQSGNNGESIVHVDVINRDYVMLDIDGISVTQQEQFKKATSVMKQLRKLYFDQSRRLAVRISQLKKGRQHSNERNQRQTYQQQQQQQQQHQVQQGFMQQQQQVQQPHHNQQSQSNTHQHQQQNTLGNQQQNMQQQQHHQQHQQQQQQQSLQHQIQINPDGSLHLPHHSQLSLHPSLHQPWSD